MAHDEIHLALRVAGDAGRPRGGDEGEVSRWRRAVQAALEVNGFAAPSADPAAASIGPVLALPPARPDPRPKPDRVLVLGHAGVLVTGKGRLPRDGEVEHDGVALRLACKGGPVLVAGALRKIAAGCRWVPASQLHRVDLAVVATLAPQHLAGLRERERVTALAAQLGSMMAGVSTGDPETDLRAALAAVIVAQREA